MKYVPTTNQPYEAPLTAKLMYSLVDGLIKKHTTGDDIKNLQGVSNKLWTKPAIRSELEEFIASYFFTDLKEPLPDFKDIISSHTETRKRNLENYVGRLEQEYGSKSKAKEEIARLLAELKKRGDHLYSEIKKIREVKGKDLIKANAKDSFPHVASIYSMMQLASIEFENIQS